VTDDAAMRKIFDDVAITCQERARKIVHQLRDDPAAGVLSMLEAGGCCRCPIAFMASSITQAREGKLYLTCGGESGSKGRAYSEELATVRSWKTGEAAKK
jgi:hypothetical protein